MSYINKYNTYFEELNGSSLTRTGVGNNGVGSGIKGVLSIQNNSNWLKSDSQNLNFTTSAETLIQGSSFSEESGGDFYHICKITGDNLGCSYEGQTNSEGAGQYSKIDEDVFSITEPGTFSLEVTGKYGSGYFCSENTKLILIRI